MAIWVICGVLVIVGLSFMAGKELTETKRDREIISSCQTLYRWHYKDGPNDFSKLQLASANSAWNWLYDRVNAAHREIRRLRDTEATLSEQLTKTQAELQAKSDEDRCYRCAAGCSQLYWPGHPLSQNLWQTNNLTHDYLFHQAWTDCDNTIPGAVRRLRFVARTGRAPIRWSTRQLYRARQRS